MTAARSYLYVPGNRPDLLAGAGGRGADALIADLEDAVPPAAKQNARSQVAGWLRTEQHPASPRWVRINSTSPAADIDAVVSFGLAGIVVPKATPELLARVDAILAAREATLGLVQGAVRVFALIETAAGLIAAVGCAQNRRVDRVGIGEVDLSAELGISTGAGSVEMHVLRLQAVIASAAAGIAAPVGPTSRDFRDLDALRNSTRDLCACGFRARTAIHPAQVSVINEIFSPSTSEVAEAERLVAAFEASRADGHGAFADETGLMVDTAVVRTARETLARAATSRHD